MALSTSRLLTANVSRNQSGVAAAIQAFITERAPNILMVPPRDMVRPTNSYRHIDIYQAFCRNESINLVKVDSKCEKKHMFIGGKILTNKHTAPLLPRTRDSAVVDPIRAVRAAISMRLPPKFNEAKAEVWFVAADMVTKDSVTTALPCML